MTMGKAAEVHIKVFEIPLSESQYNRIREFVYEIRDDEDQCLYNSLAILGRPLGGIQYLQSLRLYRLCCKSAHAWRNQPVESVLAPITPGEMEQLLDGYLIYEGSLQDYHPALEYDEAMVEDFFRKASPFREAYQVGPFLSFVFLALRGRHC